MRNMVLLLLCVFLSSCLGKKEINNFRLTLNEEEVLKVIAECENGSTQLNSIEQELLIHKINSAKKEIGLIKGIVRQSFDIYLSTNDTIRIRLIDRWLKWNKSGDWAYELDIEDDFLSKLCSKASKNQASLLSSLEIRNPLHTIERIFNQYSEYQESTDSRDNLDSLKASLKILEFRKLSEDDLTLIINVWMYYTVTDFSTLEYTEKVLFANSERSIKAVSQRIAIKKKWETIDSAPYSELKGLLEKLKK